MQDPKKLRVWHLAQELALDVVNALPVHRARKVPNLRAQAIRAATSIEWNIAEGCGRPTRKQFVRHLDDAISSANELESELEFARKSAIISDEVHAQLQKKLENVRKMLFGLIKTLRRRIAEDDAKDRQKRARPAGAKHRKKPTDDAADGKRRHARRRKTE